MNPHMIFGLSALTRPVFLAQDHSATVDALYARVAANARDAGALYDLSILHQLLGLQSEGLAIQSEALSIACHFQIPGGRSEKNPPDAERFRLLMLMQPGTFQDNTPIEFLLESSEIELELLYLDPGVALPAELPAHDLLMVGIGSSQSSRGLLESMEPWLASFGRPVLNQPSAILKTARASLKQALDGLEGVFMADIVTLQRSDVLEVAARKPVAGQDLPGFPLLIRPMDSHAGNDLKKIEAPEELADYLAKSPAETFYLSAFVDYRSQDGLYHKSRVALIGGVPYLAHQAMNDHWMIHYLNAGMKEDESKRALESAAMAQFSTGFGKRHERAFAGIHRRLGLDYVLIDCGELADGRLFVFEADNIMIVHDMDPVEIYPYKKPAMAKIFDAFRDFLIGAKLKADSQI